MEITIPFRSKFFITNADDFGEVFALCDGEELTLNALSIHLKSLPYGQRMGFVSAVTNYLCGSYQHDVANFGDWLDGLE